VINRHVFHDGKALDLCAIGFHARSGSTLLCVTRFDHLHWGLDIGKDAYPATYIYVEAR
jgi:hypothetical protein